jgi:hypothetical protein
MLSLGEWLLHIWGKFAAGSILYVDFVGYGIWECDGTTWSQLTANTPASMTVAGD